MRGRVVCPTYPCIMGCSPDPSGYLTLFGTARMPYWLTHLQDIVSCLVSGLLTIGPRFGGAIDDAARYFKDAHDK
jgi:citrate synthase